MFIITITIIIIIIIIITHIRVISWLFICSTLYNIPTKLVREQKPTDLQAMEEVQK